MIKKIEDNILSISKLYFTGKIIKMTLFNLIIFGTLSFFNCGSIPESAIQELQQKNYPIAIIEAFNFAPNSVGGVGVRVLYRNISDKTIKYVVFEMEAYNAVGDKQRCTIKNDYLQRLQYTGPLNSGKIGDGRWNAVWYNSSITRVGLVINSLRIDFMDGTTVTYDKGQAREMYPNYRRNGHP